MHNVPTMTVVNGRKHLFYDVCSSLFIKELLGLNLVKELTTIADFCHKEKAFLILEELKQFEYIGMV